LAIAQAADRPNQVERHRDGRHQERQADRRRVSGSSKAAKKAVPAPQRFGEDGEQGQDEEQHQEAHRKRDQRPAHQAALAEDAVRHGRTSAG
jgi:hypothetical protein